MKRKPMPIRHNFFSSRRTVKEAMEYAYELIEAIPAEGGSRIAAYTGFYVVLNTIAKVLEEENE